VKGGASSCIQAGYSTSYTEALRQAKAELVLHGRVNVPDFIVFLTDGEANIGSVYSVSNANYPQGGKDDIAPCSTLSLSPAGTRLRGVTIYSIGYALGNNNCNRRRLPQDDRRRLVALRGRSAAITSETPSPRTRRTRFTTDPTITFVRHASLDRVAR